MQKQLPKNSGSVLQIIEFSKLEVWLYFTHNKGLVAHFLDVFLVVVHVGQWRVVDSIVLGVTSAEAVGLAGNLVWTVSSQHFAAAKDGLVISVVDMEVAAIV